LKYQSRKLLTSCSSVSTALWFYCIYVVHSG